MEGLLDLSPPQALQNVAGYLFNQLAAIFRHHGFTNLMENVGLPPPLYGILHTLATEGPRSQSALGTRLGLDRTSMVTMCDELITHELMTKVRLNDERRTWVLQVTDSGRAMAEKAHAIMSQVQQQLLAGLSDDEQRQLTALMTRALTSYREQATYEAMSGTPDDSARPN